MAAAASVRSRAARAVAVVGVGGVGCVGKVGTTADEANEAETVKAAKAVANAVVGSAKGAHAAKGWVAEALDMLSGGANPELIFAQFRTHIASLEDVR